MERDQADEEMAVRSWRYESAVDLGVPVADATRFAESDGDLADLRRLIEHDGCDPHVAALIVA